jgi:DNA-binding transcriptional MerR regulator
MKRGGGRRYYRPDDVDLLRGIRHLLYGEGYTIRGVQRILREQGGSFVQNVWRVGAEPAPPPLEEDAQEIGSAEDRSEPALFAGLSDKLRGAEEAPGGTDPANGENRRRLELALDELLACRRIIDRVLQQD